MSGTMYSRHHVKVCSLQCCFQGKKVGKNAYVLSERAWMMEGILYSRELTELTLDAGTWILENI